MQKIAPDVFLITGIPKYAINAYFMGDVLADAMSRYDAKRILRNLEGHPVSAHALTHVHPDHQGASHKVCEALNIPLYCGPTGKEAMESGNLWSQGNKNLLTRIVDIVFTGPGHPVERILREGDEFAGFTVIETPGHSPSHIAFWRESDGVLILGDVLNNQNVFTLMNVGLRYPPNIYTINPALNRKSAKKLADLNPKIICFGHGPPLMDGRKLTEFVEKSPT